MADIFIFGDSISWGAYDEKGGWADRIKQDFLIEKLSDLSSDRCLVYPLGIPGDTSKGLAARLESEVIPRKPYGVDKSDIFVIAIGINDTRFSKSENKQNIEIEDFNQNLHKILNTLSNLSNRIIFIGLTPVIEDTAASPRSRYINEEIEKYDEALRVFSEAEGTGYIHFFQPMSKLDLHELLADGLHPNSEGHEWIYKKIKPYIEELLES